MRLTPSPRKVANARKRMFTIENEVLLKYREWVQRDMTRTQLYHYLAFFEKNYVGVYASILDLTAFSQVMDDLRKVKKVKSDKDIEKEFGNFFDTLKEVRLDEDNTYWGEI